MATLTAAQQKQLNDMMASLTKMKSDISSGKVTGLTPSTTATTKPSTTATTKPSTTTTKSTTYIPPTQQAAPIGGYKPLDASILNTITSNLGPNMANDQSQVTALQQALVRAGYMTQSEMNTGVGIYGPKTTAAVTKWQTVNGIPTSGNPGYFGPVSKNFIKTGSVSSGSPISATGVRDNPVYDSTVPEMGIDPSLVGTSLSMQPQNSFDEQTTTLVKGTKEYNDALKKLSFDYYDVMQQMLNASTQQEHAVASATWQNLKKDTESALGVTLSNDAFQAWDQLETLKNQYGEQGTEGSGLQNESVDDYLRKVRSADAQARTQTLSKQESSEMEYIKKFASPDEIKDFIAKNPDKAEQWGLIPSRDIKNAMSFSALKKKYPNLSNDQINTYINAMFDENGNYRSNLYQREITGNNAIQDPGNVSTSIDPVTGALIYNVTPGDFGSQDIAKAREQYGEYGVGSLGLRADQAGRDSLGTTPKAEYNESGAGSEGSNSFTNGGPTTVPIRPIASTVTPTVKPSTSLTKAQSDSMSKQLAAASKAIEALKTSKTSTITTTKPTTTTTKPATTTTKAIDTNYFMKPGETAAAYTKRIAAYNASN